MAVSTMLFLGFGYFVMVLGVTSHNGVVVVIQFFQWRFHGDTDMQFSFSAFRLHTAMRTKFMYR
ncbi:hypothetical protein KY290_000879 [Solanum tuberosum]|uniref:Uncharacterized protein n=1 Tax=Solanum tuberosum TaxID=4113 RepID=A0ABQ7WKJ4_SOLTU|nr:hypothetical protein KY289_000988 [Solanum tuberosum]KAH0767900.1 hypothetical protein KY285_003771 [Solanum tuberosum]KAH0781281.1 hypothetical protein KY290_000879 [Solanum tuberosum]